MPKARKGTPSKSRSPGKSSNRYDYQELNKVSLISSSECHFYGVIVDATFPYKVNSDRFICSLKVVDPTCHTKGDYASVVIYANKFEDLPIISRLGDIIRVHRANIKKYNDRRQFNVNMHYSSSWALYSTDKTSPHGSSSDGPYAFSGKRSTHEKQDSSIQGTLRKWASTFFASNNVISDARTTPLAKAGKQTKDFDVTAKVLQVFELDEYTNELKLRDASNETFYTLALKLKFPHVRQGSVVRIRSATFDETSSNKRVLILQHYSNIMTFISSSKLAASVSKVSNETATERAQLKNSVSMAPVVLTEVDKKHAGLQNTSLHDLFHSADTSTNTFRTCFYVTRVEPGNVNDAVRAYDRKSKKSSSAKGGKGDHIYQVQFLAKDVSTQFNNNVYRILLYTHEGLGQNFFQQKAVNLHSDSKASGRVNAAFNTLTRFNSWVDAVVERRNGYYFIKDTRMVF